MNPKTVRTKKNNRNNSDDNERQIYNFHTMVKVNLSISCLSFVFCCRNGLCLQNKEQKANENKLKRNKVKKVKDEKQSMVVFGVL